MSEQNPSLVASTSRKVFAENPVLVGGLVLGPLVVAATSLQNAAALSIAFAMIVLPVLLFASLIGPELPGDLRVVAYVLLSCFLLHPVQLVVGPLSPIIFDSLGIYLPLLSVNSLVVSYTGRYSERQSPLRALLDGVFFSLGFALVAFLLGGLREFLGSGALWGVSLMSFKFPAALLPFSGFILLGFFAAGLQGLQGGVAALRERLAQRKEAGL